METTTINTSLFRAENESELFSDKVEISRRRALNFKCGAPFNNDIDILEWLFAATNALHEILDEEQRWIFTVFYKAKECSISVGDVIQINDNFYICKNAGWEKIENFQVYYDQD
jgi:hypothetical protein